MPDQRKQNKSRRTRIQGRPARNTSNPVGTGRKNKRPGRRRKPERNPTFKSRRQLDAAMPVFNETVKSIVLSKAAYWEVSSSSVDDVVSHTCLKATKYWYAVPVERGQKAWIATAARNVWMDMLKKIVRERELVETMRQRQIRVVVRWD